MLDRRAPAALAMTTSLGRETLLIYDQQLSANRRISCLSTMSSGAPKKPPWGIAS
jgi:cytochrome c peroxidase